MIAVSYYIFKTSFLFLMIYSVFDFQYEKERRPITLRVNEKGEHLANEGESLRRGEGGADYGGGRDWREEA